MGITFDSGVPTLIPSGFFEVRVSGTRTPSLRKIANVDPEILIPQVGHLSSEKNLVGFPRRFFGQNQPKSAFSGEVANLRN